MTEQIVLTVGLEHLALMSLFDLEVHDSVPTILCSRMMHVAHQIRIACDRMICTGYSSFTGSTFFKVWCLVIAVTWKGGIRRDPASGREVSP